MIPRYTRPAMGRIWSDEYRYKLWLEVELLACEAMAERGMVPAEAPRELRRRTPGTIDLDRIAAIEKEIHHDVVAFITWLGEVMGPQARWLHFGMTSTDVVDTALAARLRDALDLILHGTDELMAVLADGARRYRSTVAIGRTHGVHAEPTTLGFKFAVWYAEMERNRERLRRAREAVRVGKLSGAVGTFAHLDPYIEEYVCRGLGLKPAPISTQVLQRDRHAETMTALAILGGSLEKIAVEIRHLQKTETRELEEPFRTGQKGSSAMPHKRNPEKSERISGLARVLRGNAVTAMENQALWHERDISHSSVERIILPDSAILADYMIHMMVDVLANLHVYPEAMQENLDRTGGLVYSQRVLLSLVRAGLSRQEAYALVQDLAMAAWREGGPTFRERVMASPRITGLLGADGAAACFDAAAQLGNLDYVYERIGLGGRPEQAGGGRKGGGEN